MRGIIFAALLGAASSFPAIAQEAMREESDAREVYFLIDASGSMSTRMSLAEKLIEAKIEELSREGGGLRVSRTYFRADIEANPYACETPILIGAPVPLASSKPEARTKFSNDSSPLGSALEAALLHVGAGPADIFLVSDQMQTPNCGPDVCEVAARFLPRPGIRAERIGVNSAPEDNDRLGCIAAASSSAASSSEEVGQGSIDGGNGSDGRGGDKVHWDNEGDGERWFWLLVILLAATACFLHGARNGARARTLENRTSKIQEYQRLQIADREHAEEHAKVIAESSNPQLPPHSKLKWVAISFAAVGTLFLMLLLFSDRRIFWLIDANAARKLAWMVLSSNFATALSVILASPIVFMFSQQWRLIQAQSTFGLVSGLAAQEEAKRQQEHIDNLYEKLKAIRSSITATQIDTSWADARRFSFKAHRRSVDYNDEDRELLRRTVQVLIQYAQGELPDRSVATKEGLSEAIERLEMYSPKGLFTKRRSLPELVRLLLKHGRIAEMQLEWNSLADGISNGDVHAVKRGLKKVCASG